MHNVYERVMQYNQNRDPQFVQTKYKLMASGAFRFFRGTCHLFYEDLAKNQTWKDATKTWVCGDLHIENFGSYRSHHGVVYFDLNDFDEAVLAHPTWELSRFLCSIYLAGKELNISEDQLRTIAETLCDEYLQALQNGKAYSIEKETVKGILKKYIKIVAERDDLTFLNAHSKLLSANKRVLTIDHKKYFPIQDEKLKADLLQSFAQYLNANNKKENEYQMQDVAIRVAGTGSVGLKRYVFLVYQAEEKSFYLIDVKQAQVSSLTLTPYLKIEQPRWKNQAERVITVQSFMEYIPPAWLSQFSFKKDNFIVKALQSEQDKMDFSLCVAKPDKFTDACHYMARLMAYAQLRSAGRQGSDSIDDLINFADKAKNWKAKLLEYTYNYYQQVLQDSAEFSQAYHATKPNMAVTTSLKHVDATKVKSNLKQQSKMSQSKVAKKSHAVTESQQSAVVVKSNLIAQADSSDVVTKSDSVAKLKKVKSKV